MNSIDKFDRLTQEALAQDFSGWDFSWVNPRMEEEDIPWNYGKMVAEKIKGIETLLDMGTGGGEFLSSLAPLPAKTFVTEGYPPNVPVAQKRLEPLGVEVKAYEFPNPLPFLDDYFDLVINRHEEYLYDEVYRILKPGGTFLTQQVGKDDCMELNHFLGSPDPEYYDPEWTVAKEVGLLKNAGFEIIQVKEADMSTIFKDIGAVVFYAKVIEWQFPDFEFEKYWDRLYEMHKKIEAEGGFRATSQRYLIEAKRT